MTACLSFRETVTNGFFEGLFVEYLLKVIISLYRHPKTIYLRVRISLDMTIS
jgi:hypothetical protein